MKIIETYIIYCLGSTTFYKLHECIGVNNFNRTYYREYSNGRMIEIQGEVAKELIENYGK